MIHKRYSIRPKNTFLLIKLLIIGAGISFLLALLFIRTAEASNPAWPRYWAIRPLLIMPIAGAIGGTSTYYLIQLTSQGGWRRVLAIALSLVIYLVGLWIGLVLGFDGTLWN